MTFFDFSRMQKKFTDFAYDISVGLFKQAKKTAVEFAKIRAASFYVKLVRVIRQQTLFFVLIFFGLIVYANVMGILQVAVLFYAPWPVPLKITASVTLGLLGFMAPLFFILRFFSEERWMKITKAEEWVDSALGDPNGSE